ncbi:hypothetical protein SUDANB58_00772 [Streptomyces sp. enrichment culture]
MVVSPAGRGRTREEDIRDQGVRTDLDTLLTALSVRIDDEPEGRRCPGGPPQLTDSELVRLAVAQAMLGFRSEARWLRYAGRNLTPMFPYLPKQPSWNKRSRTALPLLRKVIRVLAADTDFLGGVSCTTRAR